MEHKTLLHSPGQGHLPVTAPLQTNLDAGIRFKLTDQNQTIHFPLSVPPPSPMNRGGCGRTITDQSLKTATEVANVLSKERVPTQYSTV